MGQEAVEYITSVRDMVTSISGVPFWAWAGVGGAPIGTFYLSARVDSFEQYMSTNQAIMQNADYHAHLKTGVDIVEGPAETVMSQVIGMAGELGSEPAPLVVVTTAAAAPGRQMDAINWGVDMLDYSSELTGTAGLFTMAAVGAFSDLSWIQSYDDAASIDRTMSKLMPDGGYLERMGQTGDLFVAQSGRRVVMAKLP
jgi:hypothetical protein